ncbi:MAG: hypothetical protein N3F09_09165 [Bacteroidia bacterium]|nr:hypothetical protein [Bacteroidia bacterium]
MQIINLASFHFFASWAAYHFLRIEKDLFHHSKNYRRVIFITGFLLLIPAWKIFTSIWSSLNACHLINYVVCSLLCLGYVIPGGIRENLILRYFAVGFCWLGTNVLSLMFFISDLQLVYSYKTGLFLLERFLMVSLCLLPFDYIDKPTDRHDNQKTLFTVYHENSVFAFMTILFIFLLLCYSKPDLFPLLVAAILLFLSMLLGKKYRDLGLLMAESVLALEGMLYWLF